MSSQNKGLGRGLNALFDNSLSENTKPSAQKETSPQGVSTLALSSIIANPNQPRQQFNEAGIAELAQSIREQGIIQPIIVRPAPNGQGFQIVAGERRYRAATMAGLTEVPVVVHEYSDEDLMLAALIENVQREDLNPVEEARAIAALKNEMHITQEDLAAKLGKSRSAIANALRLLQLEAAALNDLEQGRLSAGHARALLSIDGAAPRETLRVAILEYNLSVRDTEDAAACWKKTQAFPWAMHQPTKTETKDNRRKKSDALKQMQQRLNARQLCKITLSGTEEKGKITLNYSSQEQLARIIAQLGIEEAEAEAADTAQSTKETSPQA